MVRKVLCTEIFIIVIRYKLLLSKLVPVISYETIMDGQNALYELSYFSGTTNNVGVKTISKILLDSREKSANCI